MSIMEQKWSGFIGPLCAQWFSDPAVPPKEYVVMPLLKIFLPVRAAGRRDLVERLLQLVIGLTLYGVALGLMIRGGIGVAPWDVLALGISGSTGIRYGLVTNIVAVGVLLLWIPLRQRLGIGTLLNALMLGPVADATLAVIPPVPSLWVGSALFVTGLVLLAFATGLYISADFGPGPPRRSDDRTRESDGLAGVGRSHAHRGLGAADRIPSRRSGRCRNRDLRLRRRTAHRLVPAVDKSDAAGEIPNSRDLSPDAQRRPPDPIRRPPLCVRNPQSSALENTATALWPPKPKELLIA